MSNRDRKEYTIYDDVTPIAIVSSTNATPSVVTSTAHGLANGDLVLIQAHATNTAANGIFKVANKTDNTFELTDRYSGADVAANGAGGATGYTMPAPKVLLTTDFRNIQFTVHMQNSPTMTLKLAISNGKMIADQDNHGDTPNFGVTQSDEDPFHYGDFAPLDGGGAITDGDTGYVSSGSDISTQLELNTNGTKYVSPILTAWVAGRISIKATLFNNA